MGFVSTFISATSVTTKNRLNTLVGDLMDNLQSIERINSSQQLMEMMEKLKLITEKLPTGPRILIDLMQCGGCNDENNFNHFASQVFPMLLTELIEKIDDQSEIQTEILKIATITDNADFIVETLNALSNFKLMDNHTTFTVRLLENLIRDDSYLLFCLIKLSKSGSEDLQLMRMDQYIQQLVSLPDKIANRMKASFPEAFDQNVYSAIMMLNILKSIHLMAHVNHIEQSKIYDYTFVSKMISKVMANFKGCTRAIDCVIKVLSTQATQEFYQNSVRDIFKHLQRGAIEIIIKNVFGNEKQKPILLILFGGLLKSSSEWNYMLTKKIPLFNYSTNDQLIDNLVFFYAMEDMKLMEDILMEMLLMWGTKSHVLDTSFEQHLYVTKFIVLMVDYLPNAKDLSDKIRRRLFDGVQIHIGSTDDKLRALGMITSEIVVGIIDANLNEDEKLKFDYSEFGEKIVSEIINVIRNYPTKKVILENLQPLEVNHSAIIEEAMNELISISERKTNEDLFKDVKSTSSEKSSIRIERPKDIEQPITVAQRQLDSDDDDDLQPFPDNHDEAANNDKNRPRYILDVIETFSTKEGLENPEKFEVTMNASQELIKQQLAYNHFDIAIDLIRLFLKLDKTCYCENFEELRMNCLVETCCIYPKECAQYIGKEFNTEMTKYSMRERIIMLDVLSESAKRLSKLDIPNKDKREGSPTRKSSQSGGINKLTIKLQEELNNRNKRDAQKIIQQRLLAKTRILATKTKSIHETSGINQFSNYAGWFFFPLTKGFGKEQMVFTSKTNLKHDVDNILLVKFLNTISVVLLCAENSTIAPKMAKEICNLSVFLRYHEEAKIRLAVLHMFATIILTIRKESLLTEFANELNEFMNHLEMITKSVVVNYEPDKECREFAKQLLAMCFNALYSSDEKK